MVIEKMKASIEKRLENAPLVAVARGSGFKSSSYRSCVALPYRVSRMLTMYDQMLIQILDEGGFGEFSLCFRGCGESRSGTVHLRMSFAHALRSGFRKHPLTVIP
jgi:hypothetical protein